MSKHPGRSPERPQGASAEAVMPAFPQDTWLRNPAEERRFELLRLAAFALRLRCLEERRLAECARQRAPRRHDQARHDQERLAWQRRLLQHAIFQQVVALRRLDARAPALAVLNACRL